MSDLGPLLVDDCGVEVLVKLIPELWITPKLGSQVRVHHPVLLHSICHPVLGIINGISPKGIERPVRSRHIITTFT
jgi:hypothetical protein